MGFATTVTLRPNLIGVETRALPTRYPHEVKY